jgi:hypothetical protein
VGELRRWRLVLIGGLRTDADRRSADYRDARIHARVVIARKVGNRTRLLRRAGRWPRSNWHGELVHSG